MDLPSDILAAFRDLGLPPDASPEEVRARYEHLVQQMSENAGNPDRLHAAYAELMEFFGGSAEGAGDGAEIEDEAFREVDDAPLADASPYETPAESGVADSDLSFDGEPSFDSEPDPSDELLDGDSAARAASRRRAPIVFGAVLGAFLVIALIISSVSTSSQDSGGVDEQTGSAVVKEQQYQDAAQAIEASLETSSNDYETLVELGNTYFDWAMSRSSDAQSTEAEDTRTTELWGKACDAYAAALKVKPGSSPVSIDYSFALCYSGDPQKAVEVATAVTKADPKFAMAYFALGQFQEYLGDSAKAATDYEKYLALDPKDEWGNGEFVRSRLAEIAKP